MDVPLSVSTAVIKGREKLSIWYNGEKHIINAPIKPYFYTKERLENIPNVSETVEATALSNYQKKQFYKYSFSTRKSLVSVRNDIGIKHAFESNIPFILRNRIDIPDLFTKFPHTKELKFLFLDIEQYSKPEEMFPTYEDRILSIAWCGNDRDIKCAFLKKGNDSDEKLLRFFAQKYKEIDPDVIMVYNKNYDIPTIIRRCERNNINTGCFAKDGSKPYIGGRNNINIEGVVIYDVYDSARADQSLNGNVANRGLKEVSDYFGFDSGRKPLDTKSMYKFVGTPELVDYNKDDVERLLVCFDIYWANIEFNANDLKLPLNEVTNLNITNLGLVVIGDEHHRLNIIADGLNKYRYPEVFLRKKKSTDPNYEGALIAIYRTGLFEPVYKADYSSLYPSIMSSFNLSPDTTTLLDYKPYTGKFTMKEEDQWYIYNIPDKVINKDMVIQVLKTPGFSAQLVERFLRERAEYKAKWKSTGLRKYRAMSDNRKLKANGGVYGSQGAANHAFGFLPTAIATCGAGRECAGLLKGVINEIYPKSVIEIDSVTGDTPVFVRDKKTKKIDIIPIEDLSNGSLRNVISGVETLTRSGWKNLNYVYCHNVDKNIYTIETLEGKIDVTEDHSLFSNGKEVKPSNLVKGSIIDLYQKTGVVTDISHEKRNCKVYDLGTDDGTFVGGIARVILHNTDGAYYTTKNHDEDKVKELFEERLYEKFKKDDLKLSIDVDDFKKGFFYKAKNYVLETNKGKLIFHGAAMKASSKNLISKNLIGELAVATLDRKPTDEIVKRYMTLDFPLKHFAMSITMGMRMGDYKKPDSTLVVQLAKDAKKYFNIKPELENQYHYIKTAYGYRLLELCKLQEVDRPYYRDQVRTVADMFTKETIVPKISKWL